MTSFYSRHGKRLFDVIVSACGLSVLSGGLLLIGSALYVREGSPVFFRQRRVGRNGRVFEVVKFRTMECDAERLGTVTTGSDSRVHATGRLLRRYKFDELPQLWNVLRGEMSFVGPRPDVPGYADRLVGSDRRILQLRPGITGPASLAFRNEEELLARAENPRRYNDEVIYPRKVALNLRYLDEMSLIKDLGYIVQTIFPKLIR